GITSCMLPEEYGGGGMTDCLTGCIVQEELCWGCSGIGNLVTSGGFFAEPVLALRTGEAKRRWVAALAGGKRVVHATAPAATARPRTAREERGAAGPSR